MAAILLAGGVPSAGAQCTEDPGGHRNLNGLKLYRVNVDEVVVDGVPQFGVDLNDDGDFDDAGESSFTPQEAIEAAILGAAVWDEQGNAGYFEYDGTTSDIVPPCSSDYSVIRFHNDRGNGAEASARCDGGHFLIELHSQFADGRRRPFANASVPHSMPPGAFVRDVAGIIAHELGHTQDLGHPVAGEQCVMGGIDADARLRDLYEYDFLCSSEISGRRGGEGVQIVHGPSGLGSPTVFTGGLVALKATVGLTFDGPSAGFAATFHNNVAIKWDEHLDGGAVNINETDSENGIGFASAVFVEDLADIDRIFYSYWRDQPTAYVATSVHYVRQVRSTDEFVSDQTADYFEHCTSMTGFLTCTDTVPLASRGAVAVGYADGLTRRTVMAWAHQDHSWRNENAEANEIRIAVGKVSDDTIAQPELSGVRSAVAPGLACKTDFFGSWDCLLAYVPASDMLNTIYTRRLQIAPTATGYDVNVDAAYPLAATARSANGLTAWWHSVHGRFYVAYRSTSVGQPLAVQSTTNGVNYVVEDADLGDIIGPPNAVSEWNDSGMTQNIVVYTRHKY